MGLGRKRRNKVEYDVTEAKAARALIQTTRGMLPRIRFTMVTSHDEELVIEMNYEDATKFLNMAISAHSAIAPPLNVPRMHF